MAAMPYEDDLVDPDDLKMPERAAHRRAVDLVAMTATHLLGPEYRVFRDLNWYPIDTGAAIAPDIMVLPASAIEPSPKSYRQTSPDGVPPVVVVEVPSRSDGFGDFRAKALRYQDLGSVAYVVVVDGPSQAVLRLGPDDRELVSWLDQPIPELGGLRLSFEDEQLIATLPDGQKGPSDTFLFTSMKEERDAALDRAEALERQLSALGVEPDR
jgi:Uma2 family endonuclease